MGWALRLAQISGKRVGRVVRQHRDVVALSGIESDLAGKDGRRAISRHIRPAGTVAEVAHRWNVLAGSCTATRRNSGGRAGWPSVEHGLAAFAGERPGAALGDEIHVAGMEIHAK